MNAMQAVKPIQKVSYNEHSPKLIYIPVYVVAVCDCLYINQPFTEFSRMYTFFIYRPLAQVMLILMVF